MRRLSVCVLLSTALACSSGAEPATNSGTGASGGAVGVGGGGAGGDGGAEPADCVAAERPGDPNGADALLTAGGIEYNVRLPADYSAEVAHPLIVVFSPRVQNDSASALEAFTELGPDATARGYVIAFAEWFDPVPQQNQLDADSIRVDVAASWCVDPARVYYTGHSDGGSMTTILPFFHQAPVAAVVPSAAGIEDVLTGSLPCANAVPSMVIHSADDEVFPEPGHGIGAAEHWANCQGCTGLGAPRADGCVPYVGCNESAEVLYCQTSGSHYSWYGLNASMLDFFDGHALVAP